MKILHINKFLYPFGGAESYMFGLARAQVEAGNEVEYWGMQDDKNLVNDTYSSFAKNIDFSGMDRVSQIVSAIRTIYSLANVKLVKKCLFKFKPDVVHIHNYNFQLTPSILPVIKESGARLVQTIHDSQMICPWHRLYNFQNEKTCTKCAEGSFLNCVSDKCFDGSLAKSIIGAAESSLFHGLDFYNKYIDQIISPSQFLADLVKKKVNVPIKVIPNFTNVDVGVLEGEKKEDYILYFGRISKEKGILDIQRVFEELKIKLLVVGAGPNSNDIIVSKWVKYLGPKYGNELHNLIVKAKFVIQPSKWFENCPMTIVESFALGTPVLGSNHSGFIELITEGYNGFLMDFRNVALVKERISWLMANYDLSLSSNCIDTFRNKYSMQMHMNEVEGVYNQILKN